MDPHPSTLTFLDSYPLVQLPSTGARCFLPIVEVATIPVEAATVPRLPRSTLLVLLGGLGLASLIIPFWLACGLVLLLALGLRRRRPSPLPEPRTDGSRNQRLRDAVALLPAGDAPQGRFDSYLADLVRTGIRGLLCCRQGPHLEPRLGLNRYPDLVMVTEGGYLVAVEIDEPWHWNRAQGRRIPSHEATVDATRTEALLNRGLVVVRLAEQQLAEQAVACIQLLQSVVDRLQVTPAPMPETFYRQLPWPGDRMELYRDPQRCSWPRPQPPSDPQPELSGPGGVPF